VQLNRCTAAMYHVVNEMLLSVSLSLLLFCVGLCVDLPVGTRHLCGLASFLLQVCLHILL